MAVCLNHLTLLPGNSVKLSFIPDSALAVEAFFVISGFYMALILEEKYTGPGGLRGFYKNRILRIYPAYYAIVFFYVALSLALRIIKGHWVFLAEAADMFSQSSWWTQVYAVLSNIFVFGQDPMFLVQYNQASGQLCFDCSAYSGLALPWQMLVVPQAWSIELELLFYCLAPLLVRLSTKFLVGMLLVLAAAKLYVSSVVTGTDYWSLRFPPFELSMFLSGIVAYRIYKRMDRYEVNRLVMYALSAVLFAVLMNADMIRSENDRMALLYIAMPLCVPFVFKITKYSLADRIIGELSYPIYLVHQAVMQMVLYWYKGPYPVAFAAVAVVGVSFLFCRCVLTPLEAFRRFQVRPVRPYAVS